MGNRKWIQDGYFNTETRDLAGIRRVLVLTMVLNFLATAVKLAAGFATGALSVIADGLDSLFDGLSNVVGLAGLYAASRPPDANHPYGHRKFETVAALSIAILLFITCWELLVNAWERLGTRTVPQVGLWTVVAMLVSMGIQLGTSIFELREGRRQQSEILIADALHTRASVLVSASVLGGLALVRAGFLQADPLLAAFVALVIARIGIDILRENLPVLVDQAAVSPERIAAVVGEVGGIESFHRVRSRGALGSAAVDLHIRVSPKITVREATAIADEVRRRLLDQDGINDVTVHVEPQHEGQADASGMYATIQRAASDLGLTLHEVWAHQINGNLYAEMHVGVQPDLNLGEAHRLVDRLEKEVHTRLPELSEVHTHIELAPGQVQVGAVAPAELEEKVHSEVEKAVARFPALSNPHHVRVRRDPSAGDRLFISLECTIDPHVPVTQAHYLASQLEQELTSRLENVADVSVHLEPPEEAA